MNNIFWNARSNASGAGKNYAVTVAGTAPNPAGLTTNYNDLFASGTGGFVGLFNAIDQTALSDWQTATGQDANSVSVDPQFRAPTANAAGVDLHLFSTSPLTSIGLTIAAITNDFDNDPRPATNPDIGADELVMGSGGTIAGGTYYNASFNDGDTLSGDVTVTNQLTLNGKVSTGSNTLTVDCNATVVGGGAANYVIGNLKKNFCATGQFKFDVGTANGYSPLLLTANSGTFPAGFTTKAVQGPQPVVDPSKSIQRYWTLTNTTISNADLQFQYLAGDVAGNENAYKLIRVSGGTPVAFPASTVSVVNHTASLNGVTGFSDWTVGEAAAPTAAPGSIRGQITRTNGEPMGGVTIYLSGSVIDRAITDASGNYRFETLAADGFYTVTPALADYGFSPATRSFSLAGNRVDAGFTINDAAASANVIDASEYFVRQQYLDFLGREPDHGGLIYWSDQLNACHGDADCVRTKRVDVSAAFFLSREFLRGPCDCRSFRRCHAANDEEFS